jgi:hypothetical protein
MEAAETWHLVSPAVNGFTTFFQVLSIYHNLDHSSSSSQNGGSVFQYMLFDILVVIAIFNLLSAVLSWPIVKASGEG